MRYARRLFYSFILLFSATLPLQAAIRVGVDTFQCSAENVPAETADAVTEMFITELTNTGTFKVYERTQLEKIAKEQRLSMSGMVSDQTLVKAGRLVGAEWIITGTITQYETQAAGGAIPIGDFGIALANGVGTLTLDLRAIDTTTGEVKYALREIGKAALNIIGGIYDDSVIATGDFKGLPAQAAMKAVKRAVRELEYRIGGVVYRVIRIDPKRAYIDMGKLKGAAVGDLFGVYEEGEPIIGVNGAVLGTEHVYHALIKVIKTEPNYSICRYVPRKGGPDTIRVGDLLERVERGRPARVLPVTSERLKDNPLPPKVSVPRTTVLSSDADSSPPTPEKQDRRQPAKKKSS